MRTLLLGTALSVGCSSETPKAASPSEPLGVCPSYVVVNPASISLRVGDSASFVAGACDVKPTGWRWHSSDTLVAQIDSVRGIAHARAAGVASMTAQPVVNPNIKGAALVTVAK